MARRGALVLTQPVRAGVVAAYLGELCLPLVAVVAVLLGAALVDGQLAFAWHCGAALAVGLPVAIRLLRHPALEDVRTNEALVVIALAFLVQALVVAWLFSAFGLSPLDALFEAVSAVTTTGLTTLERLAERPGSFLFARAWVQWYGGLLIVVLALALLLPPGVAAKRFAESEMGGEGIVGGTRVRARQMLVVYVLLTLAGIAVVTLSGLSPGEAVMHVFTAISTAGFSTRDASIAGFGWPVQAALMALAILGAVSFSVYPRLRMKGPRAVLRDAELWTLLVACVAASLLLAGTMAIAGGHGWREVAARAPLVALSAQTTTGFESLPVAGLDPASKAVLIGAMLIGGDVGSTAGGIKVLRFLLLLRLLQIALLRTAVPRHAVTPLRVAGRAFQPVEVQAMLAVVVLFAATIGVSWFVFLLHGAPPLDALFEVVSATCTTGLSAGLSAPDLAPALKLVLAADMWLGRLEIVAVLTLMYPPTWLTRKGA